MPKSGLRAELIASVRLVMFITDLSGSCVVRAHTDNMLFMIGAVRGRIVKQWSLDDLLEEFCKFAVAVS